MNLVDLGGGLIGLFLTLGVFSYLLGDNRIFRFVIHIFIGVTAGFVLVLVFYNILLPRLIQPLVSGSENRNVYWLVTFLISALLLLKMFPRTAAFASPVVAAMIGVGAATAVGGVVLATLFSQVEATLQLFETLSKDSISIVTWKAWFDVSVILVGTLTTLLYFQFSLRGKKSSLPANSNVQDRLLSTVAWVGEVFIAITLGAFFAGVYSAALAALLERLVFFIHFFQRIF